MGLFQHRPEEDETDWAGLPSEPVEHGAADVLDAAPAIDPFDIGLSGPVSSIVFPVAAPPPAVFSTENREPGDDDADADTDADVTNDSDQD